MSENRTADDNYIPAESLPEEEKVEIQRLDKETDEIFDLRDSLASFYRRNREYLPSITKKKGDKEVKRKMDIGDIAQMIDEGKKLKEIILWYKVEDDGMEAARKEDRKFDESDMILITYETEEDFKIAVNTYKELKTKGGVWSSGTKGEEERQIEEYYRRRWGGETYKQIGQIKEIENRMLILERAINRASKKLSSKDGDYNTQRTANARNRAIYERDRLHDEEKELAETSPEAYYYFAAREIMRRRDEYRGGSIIETPYVKAKIDSILEGLDSGQHVFIHGELGTGKTELARHIVTKYRGDKEPLIISGHKGIDITQITAAKTIQREETKTPEDQLKIITERWSEYRKSAEETAISIGIGGRELKDILHKLDTESYPFLRDAYLDYFQNPVEVKVVLAPFLQAMEEGRPVILDEINGIPHTVLIALNDYMTRKPGDVVTPPFAQAKPIVVKEGFSVITTGNYKPEDSILYPGRQVIDAAFISRFKTIVSYGYLPGGEKRESEDLSQEERRKLRGQAEFFQMILVMLMDNDYSVNIPSKEDFDKLRDLAYVAKNLQEVFEGKEDVDRGFYAKIKGDEVHPVQGKVLQENVLSVRHLQGILDAWKADSFKQPLDYYIFKKYVMKSQGARTNEELYLYRVLQTQGGFFSDEEGWPSLGEEDKIKALDLDRMATLDFEKFNALTGQKVMKAEEKTILRFSLRQVAEEFFGPAPIRKNVPREFLEKKTRREKEVDVDDLDTKRFSSGIGATNDLLKQRGFDGYF